MRYRARGTNAAAVFRALTGSGEVTGDADYEARSLGPGGPRLTRSFVVQVSRPKRNERTGGKRDESAKRRR